MPSATALEFHVVCADHVSGSDAVGTADAVPICVVAPAPLVTDHEALPAPSPVRTVALSASDPPTVPLEGADWTTTGLDVAATHVALALAPCEVLGPDARTGTTLYVYCVAAVPPMSTSVVAVVVATSDGVPPAVMR